MNFMTSDSYHKPTECKQCGGRMIFKGVGEYQCEECGEVAYDDYGIVRLYIEEHKGATAAQIEAETGISQRAIRQMLKEERLEVTKDSACFLQCECCGEKIRSGRFCAKCQNDKKLLEEMQKREAKKKNMQGYSSGKAGDEGEKRFKHNW